MASRFAILFLILSALSFAADLPEESEWARKESAWGNTDEEHYRGMIDAFESRNWRQLEKDSFALARSFNSSFYAKEASYYLGVAYFQLGDYEFANEEFTRYLTREPTPKFFESSIEHKFKIAEGFRLGKKKRFLGLHALPKWTEAGADAIAIYDEVIAAFPHEGLAAGSLYGKGQLLADRGDFIASIEAYQTLLRRFPKHPLSIESFIGIGKVYLLQAQAEYPNPDYLDLARLNLRKFESSFPGEEKLDVARGHFIRMQEYYGTCFFDTARFYERTKKWGAAKIYYQKILNTYPNSKIAAKSQQRLENVQMKIDEYEARKARKAK